MKMTACKRGIPAVFLGESTGARMPDVMGADSIDSKDHSVKYQRMRENPWTAAVLGHCYGSSAWYASLADFCVFRKGAIMAVSSPRLIKMATGVTVNPEALGGWQVHAESSGIAELDVRNKVALWPRHYHCPDTPRRQGGRFHRQ
jgi:acetyl-CoA carboxylase carboxyltransferase component